MTTNRTLYLASTSPRRQELIRMLGLPYEIRASEADETTAPGLAPAEIVETLALRKALAVHRSRGTGPGVILGADTIVVIDGRVLGKPRDTADACSMLEALQARTHEVYSGVALVDAEAPLPNSGEAAFGGSTARYCKWSEPSSGEPTGLIGHTVTKVTFRPMSDEEIRAYVATGEPLDKAGSYGVQGLGACFVEKIEGDFYSVMGLPLNLLYQMLGKFGMSPFLGTY
jgi:septum formation protein